MPVDNNLFQKNANTSLIAKLVWQKGGISRAEVARELNLYRSTVTNIASYLIGSGVVMEGKLLDSTQLGGRKAVELFINPNFGCVIGFDLQPSHCRTVILSADGTELYRDTVSFGAIPFQEMVVEAFDRAMVAHSSINIPIIAMSYSVPGIVDEKFGTIIKSFPFGLDNVEIRSLLKDRCDFPVFVENDANAAAWLDLMRNSAWGNALSLVSDFHDRSKSDPNVMGIGAGIGLILAGKVYRGSHNAAGEFKSLSWREGLNSQSGLDVEVLKCTNDDDEALARWIEDTFLSMVPLLSVVDVEKVILHGKPLEDGDWVMQVLRERVPSFVRLMEVYGFDLVFDSKDECVSASGAAMMCLHHLYSVPDLDSQDQSWRPTWKDTIERVKAQKKA